MDSPVAPTYAILHVAQTVRAVENVEYNMALTRQWSWWNTEKAERRGAIVGCLKNPPCIGNRDVHAALLALEGASPKVLSY